MPFNKKLKDLGEAEILKLLHQFCPPEVIGDDGAVLAIAPNHELVVTTDVLVDGVHFSDQTTPAKMAGWRATAANLSDLAAMGAKPLGITVALSLPSETDLRWLEDLYQGMSDCLQTYQTPLVGGDLTRSPVKTIAITAFGEVKKQKIIQRSSAQVGDVIVVTGYHGDSRAGLELLLKPKTRQNLNEGDRQHLIEAHQQPKPRLDISAFLSELNLIQPIAGMDSSDGLADAILQICQQSNVGADIFIEKIPISPALSCYQSPEIALEWALYGGEDFQLVLCMGRSPAEELIQSFGETCCIIGEIISEATVQIIDKQQGRSLQLTRQSTFQHF